MKKYLIVGFMVIATVVIGCGSPESDSITVSTESQNSDEDVAADTLQRMLQIAGNSDWEVFVDDYYGEQDKFRSTADRDALVQRFEEKWGGKYVEGLSRAAELPVRIDGDKAIFLEGDETVFILHRSQSGSWKFHL